MGKEVFTSYVTVEDEHSAEHQLSCFNDEFVQQLTYVDTERHAAGSKLSAPDLIFEKLYAVRFRNGLGAFLEKLAALEHLEVVLWTAAVRELYTGLMTQVHDVLAKRLSLAQGTRLWQHILFRDNCTAREDGSYLKDLALLDRPLASLVMVDNIASNFSGFEYNGLPIDEYWGHQDDSELAKLTKVLDSLYVLAPKDVRSALHAAALSEDLSSYKLNSMLGALHYHHQQQKQALQVFTLDSASMSTACDDAENLDFYLFNLS